MADIKISELPSLTTMTDAGEIPVVAGSATKQITGANLKTYFTGNIGFTGNAIYDLNGMIIENADLSHGATAAVIIPSNGNTTAPIQINNTYGNITLGTGPSSTITSTWKFDTSGTLTTPGLQVVNSVIALNPDSVATQVEISPNIESWSYLQIPNDATANVANVRLHSDAGNIEIAAGNASHSGNVYYWYFDKTGTLIFPNSANIRAFPGSPELTQFNSIANGSIGINALASTGDNSASILLDGLENTVNIDTYNPGLDVGYNWHFDNGGSFTLPNSPGNVYFGIDANQPVIIPEGSSITLSANRADAAQDYIAVSQDGIDLFSVNSININNSTTGFNNSDINLLSGDDIKLQGRNKVDDAEAEGGDINIWAGQGANSTQTGFDTNGGGDVSIQGGAGGIAQGAATPGGSGGYVELLAGDGGTSLDSSVGSGGGLTLSAGSAASPSDPTLGGFGGSVYISAGHTTRVNENGGSIELNTGESAGGGYGAAGYVSINIPASNTGPGGSWYFTGTGRSLEVPADSSIFGPNFGNFTVGCAGNTIVTSSDYGANVQNWVFGYTGQTIPPVLATARGDNPSGNITGYTLRLGDGTQEAIISTPDGNSTYNSSQRLVINPGKGADGTSGEGGDIYLWAGRGGDTGGSGGDIKIRGGQGGTDNGAGGYIRMEAGDGDLAGTGLAGFIEITSGRSTGTYAGGYVRITGGQGGGAGGEANISGGYGQAGAGGAINITGGASANGLAEYGNVNITAGSSTWTFNNVGSTIFPNNTISTTGNLIVETISSVPASLYDWNGGGGWNQAFYSNLATTGGTGTGLTVDVAAGGGGYISINEITIHTPGTGYTNGDVITINNENDIPGTFTVSVVDNQWTFDNTGILTAPGEGVIQSINDTVILQSKDTGTGNTFSARLGTTGGLYFETTEYPQGWLNLINNAGNANINALPGTGGAGGKSIYINAGAADQTDFYTTPGGSINITGGLGASNDGGGGGPGGNVNITAGLSADPAGHAGNVNITNGSNSWAFDYSGNLAFPSAGAFMKNVRTVTGGSVPSGFYPTYYNPTTGEFIVVTP